MSIRKIYLSGTNGLPGRYGGWDQLLSHLSRYLSTDDSVFVHTSTYDAEPGLKTCDGAHIDLINYKANGASSILYDFICLYRSFVGQGICIMLGTSGGIFFPLFRLLGLTIILNPDGEEWHRGKWSKLIQAYLYISDFVANLFATAVITDHPVIYKRVKSIRRNNVYMVPYGGDNALAVPFSSSPPSIYRAIGDGDYIFGVCRIEPENNVHLCLEAASKQALPLVFIGNWAKSSYGVTLRDQYSSYKHIHLLDPIYDPIILGSLRSNCSKYFHGHTVGGTNPSLVEALCLGLDIICHDNCFNRVTSHDNCHYFSTVDDVEAFFRLPSVEASTEMACHFRQHYNWAAVTSSYANIVRQYA